MIPFYIFALGVVGWLVFVVEMLAAGVLWAAAHTTPSNEDSFIGSQAQGYLLIMSGFFRPALMILGLVASYAVLNPAVLFINEGFRLAFTSVQADSTTGILSIAGYVLVYCTIIFSVFMTIFALPQTLPDRVLKWIGAGIGDMGEQHSASRIESQASGSARTAAMAGASKAGTRASNKQANLDRAAQAERDKTFGKIASGLEGHAGQSTVVTGPTEPKVK